MSEIKDINFEVLTPAEFEQHLPELFLAGGKVSEDPRLAKFLAANPDCAALVRDLETIAETAPTSSGKSRPTMVACRISPANQVGTRPHEG